MDSFHELAEKKPVNKITIHEIAHNCGYSPATFYRQFSDKYDLMAWDYINSCSEIMNQAEENEQSWEETVAQCCRHFYNQRQYVQNLLKNTEGQEHLYGGRDGISVCQSTSGTTGSISYQQIVFYDLRFRKN